MVDSDRSNLDQMECCLKSAGVHHISSCFDSAEAEHLIGFESPDVVLVDIAEGHELIRMLRRLASLQTVGVVITGLEISAEEKLSAMQLGASAFLTKPINAHELVLSIRNIVASKAYNEHLSVESSRLASEVHERMMELEEARNDADLARQEAMRCLARAAEFRDSDTGNHVLRVGRFSSLIASQFDFTHQQLDMIEQAAHLHDVGKIGIPDNILLKPGSLTDEEFTTMRQHCEYGSNIIFPMSNEEWNELINHPNRTFEIVSRSNAPVMKLAALIARTHHEKWNGTGYPSQMSGEEIPLTGRITAIADVFDALSSERPYKKAFSIDRCFNAIREERGKHFDPAVVDAFFKCESEILATKDALSD